MSGDARGDRPARSSPHRGWAAALSFVALLAPGAARAQSGAADAPATPKVNWALDGSITGAAALGTALVALISVDTHTRWRRQLLPFDRRLEGLASAVAAKTSDILLAVDVVMPLGLLLGQSGMNEAYGKRALLYGETVMVGLFLNGVTKYLVARPRPYTYHDDSRAQDYAKSQGNDSHLSFYSGHASTTFAASVAGAYLFAQGTSDERARAAVWGFELVLAGATAVLRTRAGKHFYSDVIVGALVGAALGFVVPRLHGGPRVSLSTAEWVAIGTAPVVGAVVAQLVPAKLDFEPPVHALVLPWVTSSGGGVALARAF
jgi:membrane-associated phospholipid phosphatase